MVKFAHFALAAQGFMGSDPGHGHGTAHQAMLRWRPTCHNWKDPQLKIYNYVLGGFGEKKEKKNPKKKISGRLAQGKHSKTPAAMILDVFTDNKMSAPLY